MTGFSMRPEVIGEREGALRTLDFFREQVLTADLDLREAARFREEFPAKRDRREELYVLLSKKGI